MTDEPASTHLTAQILSVTCDNASNNDTMTDALADLLPAFQGQYARTRCFLHILNLVAKSILRQFDVQEVDESDLESIVDDDVRELASLASDLAAEEAETAAELGETEGDEAESWVDEVKTLSAAERASFEKEVRPVKRVLVKVRYHYVILRV